MKTVTFDKEFTSAIVESAREEGIPETTLICRWVKLGKLAEEHPDMLAGDLITYLRTGEYPSTSIEDAPLSEGQALEYEAENVRMMMKMLVYALKQRAPGHSCIEKAMGLMKRLGMHKITDVLR